MRACGVIGGCRFFGKRNEWFERDAHAVEHGDSEITATHAGADRIECGFPFDEWTGDFNVPCRVLADDVVAFPVHRVVRELNPRLSARCQNMDVDVCRAGNGLQERLKRDADDQHGSGEAQNEQHDGAELLVVAGLVAIHGRPQTARASSTARARGHACTGHAPVHRIDPRSGRRRRLGLRGHRGPASARTR